VAPALNGSTIDEIPQLTNLSKVFWPDEGYTKLDLLTYYQGVAVQRRRGRARLT
jgi:DNA primase